MAASAHLKTETQTQTRRTKRKKRRETTISTSAAAAPTEPPFPSFTPRATRKREPPTVVVDGAWCCSTAPPPQQRRPISTVQSHPQISGPDEPHPPESLSVTVTVTSPSPSPLTISVSPGGVSPMMESSSGVGAFPPYPTSYTKFNTALNAGLLNPMSPPPPLPRSSPTLFEMMTKEQDCVPKSKIPATASLRPPVSVQDKEVLLQERAAEILSGCSPGNQFNDPATSDLKLVLSSKDGLSVSVNVHRQILAAHSRFFAGKLYERWPRQQKGIPHLVEINDCDDVEVYMQTLMLMYCKDIRKRLMKEDVSKILSILKVSAAIAFDAGILSCLEYLEAAPWAEDEEEKVASLLSQLHLTSAGAVDVLKRISVEVPVPRDGNEEILSQLLQVVLQGKDEKARRDMKGLVSKMLQENASQNDLSKESLYLACNGCLEVLRLNFHRVVEALDSSDVGQIARQADNLHWILDILIDRQIPDEFVKTWAGQVELSEAHSKVPAMHRYEVSRVSARLFVGIGKGQILVSKEVRCLLLQTWLEPFYDDFGWMRRACKGLDRHLIEDGLSDTILTLPIDWQQEILLAWFDRFLNSGEDCPNLQRAFEVWWRRAFWRRNGEGDQPRQVRIVAAACENSC